MHQERDNGSWRIHDQRIVEHFGWVENKVNVIGGDVVEVSPPYDTNSEITSLAATSVVDSLLKLMIV